MIPRFALWLIAVLSLFACASPPAQKPERPNLWVICKDHCLGVGASGAMVFATLDEPEPRCICRLTRKAPAPVIP